MDSLDKYPVRLYPFLTMKVIADDKRIWWSSNTDPDDRATFYLPSSDHICDTCNSRKQNWHPQISIYSSSFFFLFPMLNLDNYWKSWYGSCTHSSCRRRLILALASANSTERCCRLSVLLILGESPGDWVEQGASGESCTQSLSWVSSTIVWMGAENRRRWGVV